MSWLETKIIDLAGRAMDLAALRHTLVSSNIANVDTPGYHTRDIDFEGELRRAAAGLSETEPCVHQVRGLIARPDGNNVSLEREGLGLADTQLRYRLAAQLLRSEFHRLLTAINEGR